MLRLRDKDFSFLETVEILDRFCLYLESPELVEIFYNKNGITLVIRVNGVDVLTIEKPKILEKVDYAKEARRNNKGIEAEYNC